MCVCGGGNECVGFVCLPQTIVDSDSCMAGFRFLPKVD